MVTQTFSFLSVLLLCFVALPLAEPFYLRSLAKHGSRVCETLGRTSCASLSKKHVIKASRRVRKPATRQTTTTRSVSIVAAEADAPSPTADESTVDAAAQQEDPGNSKASKSKSSRRKRTAQRSPLRADDGDWATAPTEEERIARLVARVSEKRPLLKKGGTTFQPEWESTLDEATQTYSWIDEDREFFNGFHYDKSIDEFVATFYRRDKETKEFISVWPEWPPDPPIPKMY